MTQIKRTVCDQCGKEKPNDLTGKWIELLAQCDEMGDCTIIKFPTRQNRINRC